ncbi:hypothetical protein ACJIZ3_011236 [Penstemon smallii]|uniref:Cyclopropane-fatty-acyl-phospholipid synthase n=1 Tax=Penstemon smallii TaxID=265156 RepID=A0ABD3UIL1_9LAMI
MELSWLETGARSIVTRFLRQFITTGCLILLEDEGMTFTFEGTKRKSSLKVSLRVHSPKFYWKVAKESDLGFADAYINGDFSFVDKDEGLVTLFMIYLTNMELNTYTSKLNKRRGWWTPLIFTSVIGCGKYYLKHLLRRNTLSQARRNISSHYDLSNEFFSLFLDEFEGEDLKIAQLRKIYKLIDKARINKEHHVLEIGFGWGSTAIEIVKKTGCKYTGITLSEKQLQYAELKVKEAGLQDHINFILCDYRQLPNTYKYDRIISCEVIECVGDEFVEDFFRCCDSVLAENGLLVIQTTYITDHKYDEFRLSHGFIIEYIFPGGTLFSLNRVINKLLSIIIYILYSVVHLEEIGRHYYQTLRIWLENLHKNQNEILALGFDAKFIRMFEYYFDYCASGFKMRTLGSYQIVFNRPGDVAIFGDPYESTMYLEADA